MTAGSIVVPAIVPLRTPIPGKTKSSIDTNTKIELSTGMMISGLNTCSIFSCIWV